METIESYSDGVATPPRKIVHIDMDAFYASVDSAMIQVFAANLSSSPGGVLDRSYAPLVPTSKRSNLNA